MSDISDVIYVTPDLTVSLLDIFQSRGKYYSESHVEREYVSLKYHDEIAASANTQLNKMRSEYMPKAEHDSVVKKLKQQRDNAVHLFKSNTKRGEELMDENNELKLLLEAVNSNPGGYIYIQHMNYDEWCSRVREMLK